MPSEITLAGRIRLLRLLKGCYKILIIERAFVRSMVYMKHMKQEMWEINNPLEARNRRIAIRIILGFDWFIEKSPKC